MNVLVTGGLGFIGSHIVTVLAAAGHRVTVVDNLSNSDRSVRYALETTESKLDLVVADVRDGIIGTLTSRKIDAVIHCAGLKSISESFQDPLAYYDNNVGGTVAVLKSMRRAGVFTLVFSSSAAVYRQSSHAVSETSPLAPNSVYGDTKLAAEKIIEATASQTGFSAVALRYFNPIGAHESGLLAESRVRPNNPMPHALAVMLGEKEYLPIFGNAYDTQDGTCERDYVHVIDLARGHLAALDYAANRSGFTTFNLGTGQARSVLDLVSCLHTAAGKIMPSRYCDPRSGDAARLWADVAKASHELGWTAQLSFEVMCRDSWNSVKPKQ